MMSPCLAEKNFGLHSWLPKYTLYYFQIDLILLLLLFSQTLSGNPIKSQAPFADHHSASSSLESGGGDGVRSTQQQNPPNSAPLHDTAPIPHQIVSSPNHSRQQQHLRQLNNNNKATSNGWPSIHSQNNQAVDMKAPEGDYSHSADTWSYASPPQAKFNASSTSHSSSSDSPDTFTEGSGNGPIPSSRGQKEKFDDTEEGDDDDDDYDYKDTLDTGSGHGNEQSKAKKTESAMMDRNSPIKKPTMNESDMYLPFRPPAPTGNANTTLAPPIRSTTTNSPPTTNLVAEAPRIPLTNASAYESNLFFDRSKPSSPKSDIVAPNEVTTTSVAPPVQRQQSTDYVPVSTSQGTTERPKLTVPSTTTSSPLKSPEDHSRVTSVPPTIPSRAHFQLQNSNGSSSLLRPNVSKTSDIDYEYEEENDDDDSEDVSNFEDNETSESDVANKKTTANAIVTTTTTTVPKPPTNPKPVLPVLVPTTTVAPRPAISAPETTRPSFNSTNQNIAQTISSPTQKHVQNYFSTTTTVRPSKFPSFPNRSSHDDDINDYEDEDEKYDESEEETDEDEGENDDDSGSTGPPPSLTKWTTTQSPMPTSTRHESRNGHHKLPKNEFPAHTTNSFPSHILSTSEQHPTKVPSRFNDVQPTRIITMPTTTSTTTTTTTMRATTTTSTTTTTTTTTTPMPTTRVPVYYVSTTMRATPVLYATTPTSRITYPISKTSNILAFDRGLQDDDADLTRQLYDKAVEVYQATSKAVHAAVEAVWPPTFELNSSTFEPLLTQPIYFMLALGAAVIGLVLTMMLVVYIINYQIQPKDEVSYYYSD